VCSIVLQHDREFVSQRPKERRFRAKCGPGITRSDLLVINRIDLAPLVGANEACLVMGCAMMVQETRIAVRNLADIRRYRQASMASEPSRRPNKQ
jgi:Ni2+-binding GTPase involved in maturation of urease and hydrogenase